MLGLPDVELVAQQMTAAGFNGVDLRQHSRSNILIIRDPGGYKYQMIDIDELSEEMVYFSISREQEGLTRVTEG